MYICRYIYAKALSSSSVSETKRPLWLGFLHRVRRQQEKNKVHPRYHIDTKYGQNTNLDPKIWRVQKSEGSSKSCRLDSSCWEPYVFKIYHETNRSIGWFKERSFTSNNCSWAQKQLCSLSLRSSANIDMN